MGYLYLVKAEPRRLPLDSDEAIAEVTKTRTDNNGNNTAGTVARVACSSSMDYYYRYCRFDGTVRSVAHSLTLISPNQIYLPSLLAARTVQNRRRTVPNGGRADGL